MSKGLIKITDIIFDIPVSSPVHGSFKYKRTMHRFVSFFIESPVAFTILTMCSDNKQMVASMLVFSGRRDYFACLFQNGVYQA